MLPAHFVYALNVTNGMTFANWLKTKNIKHNSPERETRVSETPTLLPPEPDQETSHLERKAPEGKKSLENISLGSMDSSNEKENVSPLGLDNMLLANTDCIELALSYAETWSKYTKAIVSWVENKLTLDLESTRNIVRLAEATRTNIGLQEFMPLQSLFTNALLNDIQSSQLLQETIAALQTNQFVQPLLGSENEMEKQRKEMKELWKEEQNKMIETETALKNAKLLCIQCQDKYEKAKSSMSCAEEEHLASSGGLAKTLNQQLEIKRKLEEEALKKVEEANELYKVCITNVEERRNDLENTKRAVLAQLRTLVFQCDLTLKAVTVNLFYVQHLQAASLANSLQSLCNSAKLYVPGQEYNEFVKATKATTEGEVEGTINQQLARSPQISGYGPASSSEGPPFTKSWTFGMMSDSESTGGNSESRSLDSESKSPGDFHGKLPRTPSSGTMSSADDLDEREPPSLSEARPSSLETFNKALVSKSALTHKFRKLRSPRKCRDCDGIVLFQGVECEECLMVCHRKCLQNLVIVCGHQKLMGKIHLFGAEFTQVARKEPDGIPFILKICVSEIESRALCLQGIYRVAGNKVRTEKLCQALEKGMHLVATSEFSSHDICDVLKAYLRQLPEPFILFRFYNDCIQLSKELQLVNEDQEMKNNGPEDKKLPGTCSDITRIIVKSKDILSQLPAPNLNSLSYLLKHLKRVVDHAEANKMHSKNLGLIFGPCLIKPRPTAAPVTISCLSEYSHQARLVEFFLTYTHEIFDGCLQPQDIAVGSPAVMAPPADQACLPELEMSAEEREPEHPMKSLLYSFKEVSSDLDGIVWEVCDVYIHKSEIFELFPGQNVVTSSILNILFHQEDINPAGNTVEPNTSSFEGPERNQEALEQCADGKGHLPLHQEVETTFQKTEDVGESPYPLALKSDKDANHAGRHTQRTKVMVRPVSLPIDRLLLTSRPHERNGRYLGNVNSEWVQRNPAIEGISKNTPPTVCFKLDGSDLQTLQKIWDKQYEQNELTSKTARIISNSRQDKGVTTKMKTSGDHLVSAAQANRPYMELVRSAREVLELQSWDSNPLAPVRAPRTQQPQPWTAFSQAWTPGNSVKRKGERRAARSAAAPPGSTHTAQVHVLKSPNTESTVAGHGQPVGQLKESSEEPDQPDVNPTCHRPRLKAMQQCEDDLEDELPQFV
ncbi:LOW QUALITY PROTEIN: rho GTPase-activating protein 29-like [Rhynchocyon petersi]